jgi:hypothetical protein
MMSGSMNNTAAYSIEEINVSDADAMMGPILKQMEECTSFDEEGEIPFLISDNCKRFFALLWKVVVMSLHKNLPSSEAALTSEGRSAAIKASFPDELSKYITDHIEKTLAEGPPSFQKNHIELLIGSEVAASQYLLLGAVVDYFNMEFVELAGAEYDRGHYFPGKNAAKTLRELYEAMTRLTPELAAWTEGKGVLYPWMVWSFLERDETMKAFFDAAGVCGAPPDNDNNDGDVGGGDDDDNEHEGDRISKEVLIMQSSDAQFIDHMKQALAVFPFQGLLEKKDEDFYKCFLEPDDVDECEVEESDFDDMYNEVMPTLFHLCKGNSELLQVLDARLAAALEASGIDDDAMNSALEFVSDLSKLVCVKNVVCKEMDQDDDEAIKELFTAVKEGNISRLKALKANGAKAIDEDGNQLLFSFYEGAGDGSEDDEDEDQQTQTLNASKREPRPLMCYAVNHDEEFEGDADVSELIKLLVKMGADVNRASICPEQYCSHVAQYTYLGQSIVNFDFYLSRALIKAGADIEATSCVYCQSHDYDNHTEMTPLQLAVEAKYHMMVEELLKAGADPNGGECDIFCPLPTALFMMEEYPRYQKSSGSITCVELLLNAGAKAEVALEIIETHRMMNIPQRVMELLNAKVQGTKKTTTSKRGKKSKAAVLDSKDDVAPRRSARLKK